MGERETHLVEVRCKYCKEKFVPAPLHRYKIKDSYFCSWKCLQAYRDPVNIGKKRRYTSIKRK